MTSDLLGKPPSTPLTLGLFPKERQQAWPGDQKHGAPETPARHSPQGITVRLKINFPAFTLDVDLALPRQGVTALFGPSGSGKTTCLRAIAGLEHAVALRSAARRNLVIINGETWQDDARGIFVATHLRALGYVFQEASLFSHLSVAQNIAFGQKRAARVGSAQQNASLGSGGPQAVAQAVAQAVEQAVELLGIGHLQARLPHTLSGGERQRVAIARALLKDPPIMVLDEATSALDANTERQLQAALDAATQGRTTFVIAHRLATVRNATRILVFDQGRVVESGSFDELVARNGVFAVLARAQFMVEPNPTPNA